MLTVDSLRPNAVLMTLSGRIDAAELREALGAWRRARGEAGFHDLLVVVEGEVALTLGALMEDLKAVPESLAALPQTGRMALVCPPGWIETVARIERAVIPGLKLEVFRPEELAQARAWVLRESATPR